MANINYNRGTSFSMSYQHKRNGEVEPLTGATIFFTVKEDEFDASADDATAIVQKVITSHDDAAAGQSSIELEPTDIGVAVEPAKYYYDVKVKENDGKIYKMLEGRFILDGSPTNRVS
jgi:hypothetical protein